MYAMLDKDVTYAPEHIVTLIKRDHEMVETLFNLLRNENDIMRRQEIANALIRLMAIHFVAEEVVVYPFMEARLSEGLRIADHNRFDHAVLKRELYELDKMSVTDPSYNVRLSRLMYDFRAHVRDEEELQLPRLIHGCNRYELEEVGRRFATMKQQSPTHPHPWAPDRPPFETIVGWLQAPIDKLYDFFTRRFPVGV